MADREAPTFGAVYCPDYKAGVEHPTHWHVIRAGGITFAQGQCPGLKTSVTPTAPDAPHPAANVTDVLAAHEYALDTRRGAICACGFVPDVDPETLATQQDYHRAHVAAILEAGPVAEAERRGAERALAIVRDHADRTQDYVKEKGLLAAAADIEGDLAAARVAAEQTGSDQ